MSSRGIKQFGEICTELLNALPNEMVSLLESDSEREELFVDKMNYK